MTIKLVENPALKEEELFLLYDDVNWKRYTSNMKQLLSGLQSSLYWVGAYDDANLVGLIRVVGDGHTIVYIQDVLVKRSYHQLGIGTMLFEKVNEKFSQVRQMVLMSDYIKENDRFYHKQGFIKGSDYNLVLYVKFND